jgi:hypothetical protein
MKAYFLRAGSVVLAALIAILAVPAPAQASPWQYVFIESQTSGLCAAMLSAADGAAPTQETCLDLAAHLWTFDDSSAGSYRIRNIGTGKCLASAGTTNVQQLACNTTSTAQRWLLQGTGNTFRIRVVAGTNCLIRPAGVVGGLLKLGTCSVNQQWRLLY